MNPKEFLKSLSEKAQAGIDSKKVYGEPIEIKGKTLIPVMEYTYGAGGFFSGENNPEGTLHIYPEGQGLHVAGGMGVGGQVKPVGMIEIKEEQTRFIPIQNFRKIAGIFVSGLLLGWALRKTFFGK